MSTLHQNCFLCGNAKFNPIEMYAFAHLQRCASCGFVFAAPIPTLEELQTYYQNYPRDHEVSPITLKRYAELLEEFEPFRKTNRIIDVGCGDGHFLAVAKTKGWEVFGTEYTAEAVAVCEKKGIKMHTGALNRANYESESFDVITSFEVIEHINNPHEEIANFNAILRKKGLVYVTTPNFNSVSRNLLKEKWTIVEYPEHLSYYTPKTIRQVFENEGFGKLKILTTGISIGRYQHHYESQKNINDFRTADEALRQKTETNPFLQFAKKAVNTSLSMAGRGDTLKAYFRKEN